MMKTETHGNQKGHTTQKESMGDFGTTHSSKETKMNIWSSSYTGLQLNIRNNEEGTFVILKQYLSHTTLAMYHVKANKIYLAEDWNSSNDKRFTSEEKVEAVLSFIAQCNEHRSSYLNETTIIEILECGDDREKRGSITGRPAPADLLGIPIYKY
jgi:hypothetical protein